MELSIKNIQNNKQLSFKGVKGDFDANNNQVFRFSTTSYKKDEKPYLELTFLDYAVNKKSIADSNTYFPVETVRIPFDENTTLEFPQEEFEKAGFPAFAYRFVYKGKDGEERYALDGIKKAKIDGLEGKERNIIEIGHNFGVTPISGAMRHSFVDSDGIDIDNLSEKDKNFIRTHFNKLGGTIKGLTYLLKKGFFDSFHYIISTPDIGADPTSPHKYWPNNQYQCTNLEDFKEFNFELFKRGKGYVADGAFTSQSLQSPLVQHVLKWGENSPFYHMLKMDDGIKLGIIPQNKEAFEHTGVKLINSPYSKDYDKNKPTLMQFFDDRLTSKQQQEDTKNVIEKYDTPNPKDHYDVVHYQDSVHPFYFEIEHNELNSKLSLFEKGKNTLLLKDLSPLELNTLLTVGKGQITNRYNAGQATFWDGNVDIIKMNLSNPNTNDYKDVEGFYNAREYLYDVATYWTEAVQSDLIRNSVQLSEKEIEKIALKNGILKEDYEVIKANINNEDTYLPVLKENKTVEDYVRSFPLQSIETSPELSAIFSQPEFNEELLKGKTFDTVVELTKEAIEKSVPQEYKNNDEYKTYVTKIAANEILRNIYISAMAPGLIDDNAVVDLERLKNEVTLNSFLKYLPTTVEAERKQVISKIQKGISSQNINKIVNKLQKELKDVTLEDFKLADSVVLQGHGGLNWRFDAAKDIADLESVKNNTATFDELWNGTNNLPGTQQFWSEFISRIKTYNPSSYIIAEITNFGDLYQWNDYDSMMKYDPKVANGYLLKIAQDIREVESKDSELYKFANIFSDSTKPHSQRKDAFNKAKNLMGDDGRFQVYKNYENNLPYTKEQEFLEQIGASTSSNYDKYFNNLSFFVGTDPEHGGIHRDRTGNLYDLKYRTEALMKYIQPNGVLLSHVFVDNHDKPRILHTLPLDMELYVKSLKGENLKNLDDARKQKITELTGRDDYMNINSQAAAVGLMMKEKIEEIYKDDSTKKEALLESLKNLVNGTKNGENDERRAKAFGSLPYEVTIVDLFEGAGIDNQEEMNRFNYAILEKPMDMQYKLWQTMNALVGVPTMYYGTDYAQTGYETASKNVLWGNRNRALHERRNDKNFKDYYDRMNAVAGLSNIPALSALKNALPELLNITSIDNVDFFPIYRKDERNSQVLSVLNNFGIAKDKLSYEQPQNKGTLHVASIPIKGDNNYCPFDEGQVLRRKVYDENTKKYITEDTVYEVKNGAIVVKSGAKDKKIEIKDSESVLTFFVDKQLNPKYVVAR